MSQEANTAAVIPAAKAQLTVETRPAAPSPGASEILVRTRAIALNPVDWKIQTNDWFIQSYPTVLGSDVAGEVVAVGSSVSNLSVGDHVAGYAGVIYNSDPAHGAFQTHVILAALSTTKLPPSLAFADAAVFPMAVATAGLALFSDLAVPRDPLPAEQREKEAILVWGASSSVGATAAQIALRQGFAVYAVASSKHAGWISSELGVRSDRFFDRSDPDVVEKIVSATARDDVYIERAFDAIGEGETFEKVAEVVEKSIGGQFSPRLRLSSVSKWPEHIRKPAGAKIEWVLAYKHANEEKELGRWLFNDWLRSGLEKGEVKPLPRKRVLPGGFEAIQGGLDLLREGKVAGEKLVVEV